MPPGWQPEEAGLPEGVQRIDAPTPYVWIIGRTKTDGPPDYDAVHEIQAGFKITPLSGWGKPAEPVAVEIDPSIDMKTPPKVQVDRMPAGEYFAYAAEIMKLQPPQFTDQPIIARMARIGIEPGQSFDLDKVDPAVKQALESVPAEAQKLMAWKVPTLARVVNGWSMNTDTMGVYGNYYLKRAIVAQLGLGANLPEDAIYPLNIADESRPAPRRRQQLHHPFRQGDAAAGGRLLVDHAVRPGGLPGREQPRSLRAEQLDAVRVQSGRLPRSLLPEPEPGRRQGGELAAGADGPFNLTMRLYAPKSEALTGRWNPPPVRSQGRMARRSSKRSENSALGEDSGARVRPAS